MARSIPSPCWGGWRSSLRRREPCAARRGIALFPGALVPAVWTLLLAALQAGRRARPSHARLATARWPVCSRSAWRSARARAFGAAHGRGAAPPRDPPHHGRGPASARRRRRARPTHPRLAARLLDRARRSCWSSSAPGGTGSMRNPSCTRAGELSGSSAGLTPGILRAPPCLWWDARSHPRSQASRAGSDPDSRSHPPTPWPCASTSARSPGADQGTDHQPHPERAVRRHPEHPGREHHRAGRAGGGRDRGLAREDRPVRDLPARARRDGSQEIARGRPRRAGAWTRGVASVPGRGSRSRWLACGCAGLPRFDEGGPGRAEERHGRARAAARHGRPGCTILEQRRQRGRRGRGGVRPRPWRSSIRRRATSAAAAFAVWVAHDPAAEPLFLDFRESGARRLRAAMSLDEEGQLVPERSLETGPRRGRAGQPAARATTSTRGSGGFRSRTWPLPAIELAREGLPGRPAGWPADLAEARAQARAPSRRAQRSTSRATRPARGGRDPPPARARRHAAALRASTARRLLPRARWPRRSWSRCRRRRACCHARATWPLPRRAARRRSAAGSAGSRS